jgi:hypothetical protein
VVLLPVPGPVLTVRLTAILLPHVLEVGQVAIAEVFGSLDLDPEVFGLYVEQVDLRGGPACLIA